MTTINRIAEVAMLVGDPSRAAMLVALMGGRALTATELAKAAGITAQTASSHLSRLGTADLLAVTQQGRHRYHRLASPAVAQMLEGLMQLSAETTSSVRSVVTGPRDTRLRTARTCYDHLAGTLGVAIADALIERDFISLDDETAVLTGGGVEALSSLGIDMSRPRRSSRPLCKPCLDWSERRPHLAGRTGAAICDHAFKAGWIRRLDGTRAILVTETGRAALRRSFGLVWPPAGAAGVTASSA